MYRKIQQLKILLFFSLFIALAVFQYALLDRISPERVLQFIITDICILLGYYSFRGFELSSMKSFSSILVSSIMGSLFGVLLAIPIILIVYTGGKDFSRWDMAASMLFTVAAFPLIHQMFYHIIQNRIAPERYCILGSRETYEALMQQITQASHGKLSASEWIEEPNQLELEKPRKQHADVLLVADWELYQSLKDEIAEYNLANRSQAKRKHNKNRLANSSQKQYQVRFITDLAEEWLNRIPLELAEEYSDYYTSCFSNASQSKGKRLLDIVLASSIGLIGLPLMLISGLSVLLSSGFPIMFKHKRVGLGETEFVFYKFRTMKMLKQPELAMLTDPKPKLRSDELSQERITLVGKGLRKIRFDEFPQFINILNGSMSLVGPRPEMLEFHHKYRNTIPFYASRSTVPPGITGWAQIQYIYTTTLEEYRRKTEYDLYYIKNRSVLLDLQIILKTFDTMVRMKGTG